MRCEKSAIESKTVSLELEYTIGHRAFNDTEESEDIHSDGTVGYSVCADG